MRSGHHRVFVLALAAAILASACSMTPRPTLAVDGLPEGNTPTTSPSPRPNASATSRPSRPGPGTATPDGVAAPTPSTADTAADAPAPEPTSPDPTTPTAAPSIPADPGPAPTTPSGPTVPEASVYSAEQATVGITDTEIYLCGHAALIFAEAFDIRAEDLNVYFEKVNAEGGIYGRSVRIDWEDDAYSGDTAITAARTCVSRSPFALIGGIGFDQIPGVRNYVETQAKLPYIHHIAIEPTTPTTHSFSFLPTVQRMGRAFGEYIASKHPGAKVGIIARDSENFGPGHDAAVEVLTANGMDPADNDFRTRKDQHAYGTELYQLQQAGVEVVWIWESALASAEVIAQANQQGYTPTWVVFPFQLTLDVATPTSPVEGVAAWPSYVPGGYGGSSPYGHDDDIAAFEAAYRQYRPNTTPNDLLYVTWVGHKAMHQLLLDCGRDCNRNRLVGLIEAGYRRGGPSDSAWNPNCPVDFSRGDSFGRHYGGFTFYAQETFQQSGSGLAFRTTDYCWERFR